MSILVRFENKKNNFLFLKKRSSLFTMLELYICRCNFKKVVGLYPGSYPTTFSDNANVVKNCSATNSMARFENKNYFPRM
jgi:hypothetical protein